MNCKLILSARRNVELQQVKDNCLKFNLNLKNDDIQILEMNVCDTTTHAKALDIIIKKFGKVKSNFSNFFFLFLVLYF